MIDRRRLAHCCGALLLLVACNTKSQSKPDAAAAPPPPPPARIDVQLAVPGMAVAQIDQDVVRPTEQALRGIAGMHELVAEAIDGAARFELVIERSNAAEVDEASTVRAKLEALMPELPSVTEAPIVSPGVGPQPVFVRWALDAEAPDMMLLAQLHADLLARSLALPGVTRSQTCVPQRRLVIEIDPARAQALGLAPTELEAALRQRLPEQPKNVSIEQLRDITLTTTAGQQVRMGDVVAFRYGFGPPTCVAAGAHGLAASATIDLADDEARVRLEQLLDVFELPPGVELHRFSSADTVVELSVDPELALEQVAETIGRGFSHERSPWLLEVGVDAPPCMTDGTHVRLNLHGSGRADRASLASFRSIPGVTYVWSSNDPSQKYAWLHGPDSQAVREQAQLLQTRSTAQLHVHALLDTPKPELTITPDRERMAMLGLSLGDLGSQLQLARVGVEVGKLFDDAGLLPVWLRIGDDEQTIEQLRELPIRAADQQIPLASVAELRMVEGSSRSCRHDGRPAVLLAVRTDDPGAGAGPSWDAWSQLAAQLPANFAWSWRE